MYYNHYTVTVIHIDRCDGVCIRTMEDTMLFHSAYRGADIYKNIKPKDKYKWTAILEDGMWTYSMLEYHANTLKGVKNYINDYYKRMDAAYKI